jgi:hypothetical protein
MCAGRRSDGGQNQCGSAIARGRPGRVPTRGVAPQRENESPRRRGLSPNKAQEWVLP